jgi:hypothetical protein
MWFKHRAWIAVAWLACLTNVVAVWFAANPGETWHAPGHPVLGVLFGLAAQHLQLRNKPATGADIVTWQELEARLPRSETPQMAQALEAMAVEVERIGEGQRYLTKILTERDARSEVRIDARASKGSE